MSLAILFHFLCIQHVLDINIPIIRSLRLCCWITTSVILFSVRCVLEIWRGWVWVVSVLQAEPSCTKSPTTQRTENKTTDVVIQQHSRKHLMMDVLMSETCWAHKKQNKISSDMKLVFYSSVICSIYFCNMFRPHWFIFTLKHMEGFSSSEPVVLRAVYGCAYRDSAAGG